MSQNPRPLTVKLIGAPRHPLATLWYVWEQSRTNSELPSPEEVQVVLDSKHDRYPLTTEEGRIAGLLGGLQASGLPEGEIDVASVRTRLWDTIVKLIDEDIPCTENLTFNFALENVPISLREQLVRHRIGVTIGERMGCDIVPEIAKSSWWSQTMRMLPMDHFFTEGRYVLPESLKDRPLHAASMTEHLGCMDDAHEFPDCESLYTALLHQIEAVYNRFIEVGVPMEDARQIIPIGATHGLTWSINLKAMSHVLGKRACWVAQVNLWADLISGMVNALCAEVHPIFRKLIAPPCMKAGKYNKCPYFAINEERVQGRDHMPPCPMWVHNETPSAIDAFLNADQKTTWSPPIQDQSDPSGETPDGPHVLARWCENQDIAKWSSTEPVEQQMLTDGIAKFEKLWQLNVRTGESL